MDDASLDFRKLKPVQVIMFFFLFFVFFLFFLVENLIGHDRLCLIKEERCSSDGLLIFYGPVNVVELGRELRNSVILHCHLWEAFWVA